MVRRNRYRQNRPASSIWLCTKGRNPIYHRLLVRGKRVNAIIAISSVGVLATELITGIVNGERLPYDSVNPCSIIIMDNCAIHHVDAIRELLQQVGIVLFLPPYSPDRNLIEETVILNIIFEGMMNFQETTCIIEVAFKSITAEHCNGWITHAGYTPSIKIYWEYKSREEGGLYSETNLPWLISRP